MSIILHGARCAFGPDETMEASIRIDAGRISRIWSDNQLITSPKPGRSHIDLSGFLLMPGLINAHDHLQYSLFPRLANPPYQNYIEWGRDIHAALGDVIAQHNDVPRDVRLRWGGIRNLLCGVTTVCHHDPLWPELRRTDFSVRVLQQFGWAHSPALGGDLHVARAATPAGAPFIMHACEGVDDTSRQELWQLDQLGLLNSDTVLVHALALDPEGAALLRERKASVILCPSSNQFLFGKTPRVSLLTGIETLAIGNDSPLTALGDLLDEVHFAARACNLSPRTAYRMVTEMPATVLRLNNAEGLITQSGAADLIAVHDTGGSPADHLQALSSADVEFVMIRGRVQLASPSIFDRLPAFAKNGLEPLSINGAIRWLRAPVANLLDQAEEVLGRGQVRLGGRLVCAPEKAELPYAC